MVLMGEGKPQGTLSLLMHRVEGWTSPSQMGLNHFPSQAAFLLPWKRLFNITDAQLYVAKRDNAKQLFSKAIESIGGELPGNREGLKVPVPSSSPLACSPYWSRPFTSTWINAPRRP